jgi:outer membrane protein OmpA-like peptidoglycan-associated protein
MRSSHFALLLVALFVAGAAYAQQEDAEGCRDATVLKRMPGSWISDCEYKEFDSAELQVGPMDSEGEVPRKTLEGKKEYVLYGYPEGVSQLQVIRNAENALKSAGFTILFNGKDPWENPMVTARKGAQWIEVRSTSDEYAVTTLRTEEMEQVMEANADAWAAAIRSTGRVAIHGINFDTGKATIRADSEPVLKQVLVLMQDNPDWKLRIVGHTDDVGEAAANQTLSEARAAAVVKWLTAQGMNAARLTSVGRGESQPAVPNESDEARAQNRRVELVKI